MDTLLYYQICFLISVILTIIYIYLWHSGIDVNMTCLFVLLPIVNLGCVWMKWAPTVEVAILANKIVYLAGCFWPVLSINAIFSLCNLKIKKWQKMVEFSIAFIFYYFALGTDRPGPLYKSIDAVLVGSSYELFPEYGWMHTVIYVVMALYAIIGVIALIYAMKNKLRASITNMYIMLIAEIITMIVFFIYGKQKLAGSPAILYVVTQLALLIVGYRSYYYDIDSSVMDTIITEGKLGYITFDKKKHLLGCNNVSESLFPELKSTRADKTLDNLDGIKSTISECLDYVEKNKEPITKLIPKDDKFYEITVDEYLLLGRKKTFRIIIEDDTDHQNLITLLNKEKDHVSDTLNRYVDSNIVNTLLSNNDSENDSCEERNITVLFADIRGFTTFSENKSPREVLTILNLVLETITNEVKKNNGIIDKFIGDCVMAAWDNPKNQKGTVKKACKAALDIQNAIAKLGLKTEKEYGSKLHVGIGINYGPAIIGNVGTKIRSDYTAIGDTVNVASRLEGIAKEDEILVPYQFKEILKDKAEFDNYLGTVKLKGRKEETKILKLKSLK